MFRRILVPSDGTEHCTRALDTALRLARVDGATIVGIHASLPPHLLAPELGQVGPAFDAWRRERDQMAQDAMAYIRRRAFETGVPCETVLVPGMAPHDAIVRTARERDCDLIVMSSRARAGLAGRLGGSATWKVLSHSDVPLLVLR